MVPIVRKLMSGAVIKDGDHAAHIDFFTQLVSADATATTLKQRNLLDRFDYCGAIIEKRLPHLAERWWRKDQEKELETGSGFGFDELKAFVSEATRICAKRQNIKDVNLVKTNATDATTQPKPADKQKKPTYADATRDSPAKPQPSVSCRVCASTGHDTVNCPHLNAMPMDQKSEKIKEFKLCFGCLMPNHTQRRCQNPPTCGKCGKVGHNILFCGRKPTPSTRNLNQGGNIPRLSANATSFNPANPAPAAPTPSTAAPIIDISGNQSAI